MPKTNKIKKNHTSSKKRLECDAKNSPLRGANQLIPFNTMQYSTVQYSTVWVPTQAGERRRTDAVQTAVRRPYKLVAFRGGLLFRGDI